jgi:hypothetical protein
LHWPASSFTEKKTRPDQWERYLRQAVATQFEWRPRLRLGERLPYRVLYSNERFADAIPGGHLEMNLEATLDTPAGKARLGLGAIRWWGPGGAGSHGSQGSYVAPDKLPPLTEGTYPVQGELHSTIHAGGVTVLVTQTTAGTLTLTRASTVTRLARPDLQAEMETAFRVPGSTSPPIKSPFRLNRCPSMWVSTS